VGVINKARQHHTNTQQLPKATTRLQHKQSTTQLLHQAAKANQKAFARQHLPSKSEGRHNSPIANNKQQRSITPGSKSSNKEVTSHKSSTRCCYQSITLAT